MTTSPHTGPGQLWLDRATRMCGVAVAERLLDGIGAVWTPPPTIPTSVLLQAEYDKHFPQLLAHVSPHMRHEAPAGEGWELSLSPAACYHTYPLYASGEFSIGSKHDVLAWCYRHESGVSALRRTHFRMLERVFVGDPETVDAWIAMCRTTVKEFFADLGLVVETAVATDPFFGGPGKLLEASQVRQQLKTEFVCEVDGAEVALASLNNHRDHLTSAFRVGAGAPAPNSACLAFGLERVALALWHAGQGQEESVIRRLHEAAPMTEVATM